MKAPEKYTANRIRAMKGREQIVCLTAYDYATAQLVDAAGIHLILVGDSLAMTVLGYDTTLPVTVEQMLHHTAAAARGVEHALLVADMPFMSYHASTEEGVRNAGRFVKSAGADAVKIEGGASRRALVEQLVDAGIPVLGHIGLTPQSIRTMGGYKVQGKTDPAAEQLLEDARVLNAAGVFAIVLECVPAALGGALREAVDVPIIGIGAGPQCDGQILVFHDILGLFSAFTPKFAKRYAELGDAMKQAFETYRKEVQDGHFPAEEHCF